MIWVGQEPTPAIPPNKLSSIGVIRVYLRLSADIFLPEVPPLLHNFSSSIASRQAAAGATRAAATRSR